MDMRPILELRPTDSISDSWVARSRLAVMRVGSLPSILELGPLDVRERARELTFALLRGIRRGNKPPDVIRIAADLRLEWDRRVVANLSLLADPSRESLRTITATSTDRTQLVPMKRVALSDVAKRHTRLLKGHDHADALALVEALVRHDAPPSQPTVQASCRAALSAAVEVIEASEPALGEALEALVLARYARQPVPLSTVRGLRRSMSPGGFALVRLVTATHLLLNKQGIDLSRNTTRRQTWRIERGARRLGHPRTRGNAAAWRRSSSAGSQAMKGLVRSLRVVLLTHDQSPGVGLPTRRVSMVLSRLGALAHRGVRCAVHLSPDLRYRASDLSSGGTPECVGLPPSIPQLLARCTSLGFRNEFRALLAAWPSSVASSPLVPALSLGLFGDRSHLTHPPKVFHSEYLPHWWSWQQVADSGSWPDPDEGMRDIPWLQAWQRGECPAGTRRELLEATRFERSWSRKLVLACMGADLALRAEDPEGAVRSLSAAAKSYAEFRRLETETGHCVVLSVLDDFEARCARVLVAMGWPQSEGAQAVHRLRDCARAVPKVERGRTPLRVMEALGAIVTAGRGAGTREKELRVAAQLARMLGARLLFEGRGTQIVEHVPQTQHTLDSWSMRRLVAKPDPRAVRVRPTDIEYTLAQRRPGSLLVGRLGSAVFCFGRDTAFRRREVEALSTIAAFYDSQVQPDHVAEAAAPTVYAPRPSLARPIQGLVGESAPWTQVLDQIWRLGPSTCNVLILGESGTGKEHVARALHLVSDRAQGPFVPVHCGGLAPELMFAELFGHVAGAFTGATTARPGLIASADGGTLFLDELGEIPAAMQVALLRVLEDRCVRPVGGTRDRAIDVRILAATHQDLDAGIANGTLRLDFYHRLDVARIRVPALRERRSDIRRLAMHLLEREGLAPAIDPAVWAVLESYAWPGNVRELANVLTAATLLSQDSGLHAPAVAQLIERRRAPDTSPSPEAAVEPMGPRATRLLDLMGDGWCGTRTLAERTGVSTRTINREIARLVATGTVQATGAGSRRKYRRV